MQGQKKILAQTLSHFTTEESYAKTTGWQ